MVDMMIMADSIEKCFLQTEIGTWISQLEGFLAVEMFGDFRAFALRKKALCFSLDPFMWPNRRYRVLLSTNFNHLKRDDPSDTSLRRRTPFFLP